MAGSKLTATTYTWDGGGDGSSWTDANNWDLNSGHPDDLTDTAIFNAGATTVTLNTPYTVNIDFQTAGWTLNGTGKITLSNVAAGGATDDALKSAGAGTNTIENDIHNDRGNSWVIATGNSLVHEGDIQFSVGAVKEGAGTLIMNSTSSTAGSAGIDTDAGTTLFNHTGPDADNYRPAVDNGATLGGSGTIQIGDGADNLQLRVGFDDAGGTLAPGGDGSADGGAAIGTLSVDFTSTGSSNVVRITDTGTFAVDINTTTDTSDLLAITRSGSATTGGTLQIDGTNTTLDIDTVSSLAFDSGDHITIATYVASPSGTFTTIDLNGSDPTTNDEFFIHYGSTKLRVGRPYEWNNNGDGNWNNNANWVSTHADGAGLFAVLGDSITSDVDITLTASHTVGSLYISEDGANNYRIVDNGGSEKLIFEMGNSDNALLQVDNSSSPTISAGITLEDNLSITQNSSGTLTLSGVIADGTGAAGITKLGTGTVVLSGSNTYTGTTTVSAGTLQVQGNLYSGASSGSIVVESGGTLLLGASDLIDNDINLTLSGGTFNTNGLDETLANLTLTANSVIDLGDGDSVIDFTGTVDTGTYTLSVHNWNGNPWGGGGPDQLKFTGNVTAVNFSNIHFYTDSGTTLWSNDGAFLNASVEVLPTIPEPSTWLCSCLLLGMAGRQLWRRHRQRSGS